MITLDVADVLACCASSSYAEIVASGSHSSLDALIDRARCAWWQQVPSTCQPSSSCRRHGAPLTAFCGG